MTTDYCKPFCDNVHQIEIHFKNDKVYANKTSQQAIFQFAL